MEIHLQRYQLSQEPFSKSLATKDAYQSADFKECAARLDYLERTHGLALMLASPGFGKSLCLRAFCDRQNPNLTRVVYLCLSTLSAMEFYRQLSVALGLEPRFRKADMFRAIQEQVAYLADTKRVHLVIVIDEAQYLSTEVLRDLKMLMNFDYDSRDRFSLVLCGQPVLADLLLRQVHEALRQRIVVNYTFKGLSATEAKEYASRMVSLAKGPQGLIEDAALSAAYNGSNRAIRVLGQILGAAIRIGAQNNAETIDAEMVMAAANEIAIR
jgi:type II secretory pathway predicted ATPase ExeA